MTYYDARSYAKDYQEGLDHPSLNIASKSQDKGYYHRSGGVFIAMHDGRLEGFNPATSGAWAD